MKKHGLKKHRVLFDLALILGICGAFLAAFGPQLLGDVTTTVFEGIMAKLNGTGRMDFSSVYRTLVTAAVLYLAGAVFAWASEMLAQWAAADASHRARDLAVRKSLCLSFADFESRPEGEVLTCMTDDAEGYGDKWYLCVLRMVVSWSSLLAISIMILRISPVMACCAALIILVAACALACLLKRAGKYEDVRQDTFAGMQECTREWIGGRTVLKLFGCEQTAAEKFSVWNTKLCELERRADYYSAASMQSVRLISNVGFVFTAFFGGFLAAGGALPIGDIQAFIHYIRNLSRPVEQIAKTARVMQEAKTSKKRLREFLKGNEEADDIPAVRVSDDKRVGNFGGAVSFSHVTFGYTEDTPVLRDFSFEVKPGEKVAVVGHTGAGKTTLTRLMLRFYDVSSGTIRIDGIDVRSYGRKELRKRIGIVMQDTWFFEDTIWANIRYGRPDATDEEVRQAAQAACADTFIETLPEKYDTVLKNGGKGLSRGQRQLLSIARTILLDPEILILDEATSSVDVRTEMRIRSALTRLTAGRTCFIIAHRRSTIRGADRILTVEDGIIHPAINKAFDF